MNFRGNQKSRDALMDAALRAEFQIFLMRCFQTLNPGMEFCANWHIAAMGQRLEWVRRQEINRVIINLPPRHLKSLTVSVAFPAFILGHDPSRRICAVSYGSELANKHGSDFRSIVESSWYKRAFPNMRIARCTEAQVTTTKKGSRIAVSVGGALTGLGGDMFIIDDPQKPADALSEVRRDALNR